MENPEYAIPKDADYYLIKLTQAILPEIQRVVKQNLEAAMADFDEINVRTKRISDEIADTIQQAVDRLEKNYRYTFDRYEKSVAQHQQDFADAAYRRAMEGVRDAEKKTISIQNRANAYLNATIKARKEVKAELLRFEKLLTIFYAQLSEPQKIALAVEVANIHADYQKSIDRINTMYSNSEVSE